MRPRLFEEAFIQWVESLKDENITKEVISVDGKCIKGSKDSFHEKNPIHMVSAWASANQLVLGQTASYASTGALKTNSTGHWTWFLTKTSKGKGARTPPKTMLLYYFFLNQQFGLDLFRIGNG